MALDDGGRFQFAHHQLDVYGVALKLVVAVRRLMERVFRGHRSIADQGLRASASTVLLIAEGANRRTAGDRRQRKGRRSWPPPPRCVATRRSR